MVLKLYRLRLGWSLCYLKCLLLGFCSSFFIFFLGEIALLVAGLAIRLLESICHESEIY